MLTETQIQEAANRMVAALKPKKIILFGSYARGNATENSDLDLMVIASENSTNRKDMMKIGGRAVGIMGVGGDVLVYYKDAFIEQFDWCKEKIHD